MTINDYYDDREYDHEAWRRCLERQHKTEMHDPPPSALLHAARRSAVIDHKRRQAASKRGLDRFVRSTAAERFRPDARYASSGTQSDNPSERAVASEATQILKEALLDLSTPDRELIKACDLNGESVHLVAARLGQSVNAVRSRRYHAHQRLRPALVRRGITEETI